MTLVWFLLGLYLCGAAFQAIANRIAAYRLSRELGQPRDVCLADILEVSVKELRRRRRENLVCVIIGIVVSSYLHLVQ